MSTRYTTEHMRSSCVSTIISHLIEVKTLALSFPFRGLLTPMALQFKISSARHTCQGGTPATASFDWISFYYQVDSVRRVLMGTSSSTRANNNCSCCWSIVANCWATYSYISLCESQQWTLWDSISPHTCLTMNICTNEVQILGQGTSQGCLHPPLLCLPCQMSHSPLERGLQPLMLCSSP
jgi:hypothetical protein